VFDLVYADGQRLFKVPLEDRKRLLRNLFADTALLKYSEHVIGEGKAFFKAAKQKRLEGIVAKLRDSPYQPGARSGAWRKIKAILQQEVVIGGFTAPRASRNAVSISAPSWSASTRTESLSSQATSAADSMKGRSPNFPN
jgi:bifunctional non-homologous end joining protein LigD